MDRKVNLCGAHYHFYVSHLAGGEAESEEDEEDEAATELKKPNSDEVRAVGKRVLSVCVFDGLIDGLVLSASLRAQPAVR